MNLPNYFLADLPPEATVGTQMISEACQTLKRNRERYLAPRSTQQIAALLGGVGSDWLRPDSSFRKLALAQGPDATGFSAATLQRGLDSFFRQLTRENILALVEQDLGHVKRLDEMSSGAMEGKSNRASIATGPQLIAHIGAGNVPNSLLSSMVLGLLARSAQFVKCASGTSLLPRLFAHSVYEADSKLGACLEVAEWKGGNVVLEEPLYHEADCITATGDDETIAAVRRMLPPQKRFLGYGHRVSFGFVAAPVLTGLAGRKVAARAAADVVAWDQLGCLSPHVIYVQQGGGFTPEQFAEMLAEELQRLEAEEPRGKIPTQAAAAISTRRSILETRAAFARSGQAPPEYPQTALWTSRDSTAWTVAYESEPQFQMSCLNRFVYVKPVSDLQEALAAAELVKGKVSTVGLAAGDDEAQELATQLSRWGVSRVCPLGRMQDPPLTWRHDGRPALAELVSWTDWEMT